MSYRWSDFWGGVSTMSPTSGANFVKFGDLSLVIFIGQIHMLSKKKDFLEAI